MYSVLIVDDERIIRNGLRDLIPWQELEVERVQAVASAQEALVLLEKEDVDLLLTDICMPETTGIEMVQLLNARRRQPPLRTIVLTGYNDFEYARQCCSMEVHDFLLKPINEEILIASVRTQLAAIARWREQEWQDKVKSRAEEVSDAMRLEWALRGLAHDEHKLSDVLDILARYGYDTDRPVQTALVIPHLPEGQSWEGEAKLHMLDVKHLCLEMVDAQRLGITFEDSNDRLGIVFFADGGLSDVCSRLEQLADRVRDENGNSPKMILGSHVGGLDRLQIAYDDAIHLLNEAQDDQSGQVYRSRQVKKQMQQFYSEFENSKMLLCSNLADEEKMAHGIKILAALFERYNLSQPSLRRCCFEVTASAYFTFLQETGNDADDRLVQALELIRNGESASVLDMTREFLLHLYPQDASASNRIIMTAKQYINENLAAELSVSSVAAQLYVNANYFSRLFKQTAGEGCNEYITRKRMERAKMLLETSSMKTGQVAEVVGYKDKNYFSLAFKKNTGIAPTVYRSKTWKNGGVKKVKIAE